MDINSIMPLLQSCQGKTDSEIDQIKNQVDIIIFNYLNGIKSNKTHIHISSKTIQPLFANSSKKSIHIRYTRSASPTLNQIKILIESFIPSTINKVISTGGWHDKLDVAAGDTLLLVSDTNDRYDTQLEVIPKWGPINIIFVFLTFGDYYDSTYYDRNLFVLRDLQSRLKLKNSYMNLIQFRILNSGKFELVYPKNFQAKLEEQIYTLIGN